MRAALACLVAILLALAATPTHAEDKAPDKPTARRISLPHAALSFTLLPGWTLTQFDGSIADLSKNGARIWVYAGKGADASRRMQQYADRLKRTEGVKPIEEAWRLRGIRDAARVWYDTEYEHRAVGALTRDDDSNLDIEALVPKGKQALVAEVRKTLDSFDANPFKHPRRLVHWGQNWTLDLAQRWEPAGMQAKDVKLVFESSALYALVHAAKDTLRLSLHKGPKTAPLAMALGETMQQTLRKGTHPGAQRDLAKERAPNHFPGERGPQLTFKLPSRWSLTKPTSSMRLAQFQIPGNPPLFGVAFFFGKGSGGSLDANMTRWTGQLKDVVGTPTPKTTQVVEGITATTLDVQGTYNAQVRPGSTERVNKPNHRMLATYIELDGGPLMIKIVGPSAAVAKATDAYHQWIASFRLAK